MQKITIKTDARNPLPVANQIEVINRIEEVLQMTVDNNFNRYKAICVAFGELKKQGFSEKDFYKFELKAARAYGVPCWLKGKKVIMNPIQGA